MAVLRRAVDVAERAGVRDVLRDEADLVHGMVVQAVLRKISFLKRLKIEWFQVVTWKLNKKSIFYPVKLEVYSGVSL